jgi:hypothetical protein
MASRKALVAIAKGHVVEAKSPTLVIKSSNVEVIDLIRVGKKRYISGKTSASGAKKDLGRLKKLDGSGCRLWARPAKRVSPRSESLRKDRYGTDCSSASLDQHVELTQRRIDRIVNLIVRSILLLIGQGHSAEIRFFRLRLIAIKGRFPDQRRAKRIH